MKGLLQHSVDLLIPQTVDDGVAEGRDHRVDDGQHLVEVHGLDATGAAVDEESC